MVYVDADGCGPLRNGSGTIRLVQNIRTWPIEGRIEPEMPPPHAQAGYASELLMINIDGVMGVVVTTAMLNGD
jgi:hypothetical protein